MLLKAKTPTPTSLARKAQKAKTQLPKATSRTAKSHRNCSIRKQRQQTPVWKATLPFQALRPTSQPIQQPTLQLCPQTTSQRATQRQHLLLKQLPQRPQYLQAATCAYIL